MRTSRLIFAAALLLAVLLIPSLASADGITWTLSNVNLLDGGTVTGSFNYNATTNAYSAINVSSTAGLFFGGASYSTVTDAVMSGATILGLGQNPFYDGDLTGQSVLELFFNNALTNAGGTDSVFAAEFICTNATCILPITRISYSGNVTSSPVGAPEPASFLLLAAGLLTLVLLRFRA
jgi:hypothetical protein